MIATIAFAVLFIALLMTALDEDAVRQMRDPGLLPGNPLLNDAVLYRSAICCYDANGEIQPGDDASGFSFAGIYLGDELDNADDGESADLDDLRPYRATGSGFAQSNLGDPVFVSDDNTVALSGTTYAVWAGNIIAVISATEVWIAPPRFVYITLSNVTFDAEEVADPDAAVSTADYFTSIASDLVEEVSLTAAASALASPSLSATPTSAEITTWAAEIAKLAADDTSMVSAIEGNASVQALELAEADNVGADARGGRTGSAAAITALKTLELFTDPS